MTAQQAEEAIKNLKKSKTWVCNGFGSIHGWRHGRLWFVCAACRWHKSSKKENQ